MTANKDLKRLVRARMKKTGEAYTAARARIISKPGKITLAAAKPDYAALAGMSGGDQMVSLTQRKTIEAQVAGVQPESQNALTHIQLDDHGTSKIGLPGVQGQVDRLGYWNNLAAEAIDVLQVKFGHGCCKLPSYNRRGILRRNEPGRF